MKSRLTLKTFALLLRIIEAPPDQRHSLPLRAGEWLCYWSLRNRNLLDSYSQPRPGVVVAAQSPRFLSKCVELSYTQPECAGVLERDTDKDQK